MLCPSKSELQAELNQTRKIDGVGNESECCTAERSIRRPELRMVEEIEELRPEFNIRALCDASFLEDSEVEVIDTLLPQRGVDARFVTEAPRGGIRKAGRIEPSI